MGEHLMDNVFKDIYDINYDIKTLISRVETARQDVDRGVERDFWAESEGIIKEKRIEYLVSYLIDAKNDFDRLRDDLKEVHNRVIDLVDTVEYEAIAKEIRT